ncbi:uncharacterized protein LOC128985008 [Macrosteles quadrilineatus]|uniref:uncharacterized protein LOC128985008 n=1 Tax=Macrosteles quadrilineatus TaxID=74068 RepID=UPI0023E09F91|nr:uncharacterized protein LOC128985008 [Macrosteles quadrilineatus]
MASSDSERSIAGISLPQWMKNKINDRYDLDQNTFSPPTEDDSFFFIRYPKTDSGPKQIENDNHHGPIYRNLSEVLENHTLPCQEFIPAAKSTPRELGLKRGPLEPPLGKPKSTGTDDGFHSAAAACGHSVVAVAHQIIAGGKLLPRYPRQNSSSSLEPDDEPATPPASHMLARRRGSKSLPSSPQTSPKTLRKNPYFTNVLLGSSDNVSDAHQCRGWLLSYVKESKSLRGSLSDLKIAEESDSPVPAPQPKIIKPKQVKPKPSQLREMNFWSPTSM